MHTTATPEAGPAAPATAAAKLPSYLVDNFVEAVQIEVQARPARPDNDIPALVGLYAGSGGCSFHHSMTPAQARQLAVYLVDCANALDNPAGRVIVDDADDWHGPAWICHCAGAGRCVRKGERCGRCGAQEADHA